MKYLKNWWATISIKECAYIIILGITNCTSIWYDAQKLR